MMPEIHDKCLNDLIKRCGEVKRPDQKGEELRCLQKNLKDLEEECRDAIKKITEIESQDIRIDQILMKSCLPIINEFCQDTKDGKGDLLECLIKQKNNPKIEEKCKCGIEHHQLINMEDVR